VGVLQEYALHSADAKSESFADAWQCQGNHVCILAKCGMYAAGWYSSVADFRVSIVFTNPWRDRIVPPL
jgi:hypothetical protein